MQALLGRTQWDQEKARVICRDYVIERLGDPSGVLVLDETGFLKKGSHSVGVARQYSGTAGRIENCQIGVFLGYASPKGQALIDRRLYLPKDWIEDAKRRERAGVPEDMTFATKPKIGAAMVAAAIEADVPCAWVLGDSVYGSDKSLRVMLESHEKPYVLCVRGNERLMMGDFRTHTAEDLAAGLSAEEWRRLPAGQGSKGPRLYDWARVRLFRLAIAAVGSLAAGSSLNLRSNRHGVLCDVCPRRHDIVGTRRRRRFALDDRGMLPVGQGRDGARPLRSALLAWLASTHDVINAGSCLSRRLARPFEGSTNRGGLRQSEQNESVRRSLKECVILVTRSVQELRRLIVHLRSRRPPDSEFPLELVDLATPSPGRGQACPLSKKTVLFATVVLGFGPIKGLALRENCDSRLRQELDHER